MFNLQNNLHMYFRCEVQNFISEFTFDQDPFTAFVYKLAYEFWNELLNFATNFQTAQQSLECYSEKLS